MRKCKLLKPGMKGDYYTGGYYANSGESPGQWRGQGAKALQLSGVVDAVAFDRLLAGCHPRTGVPLVQIQKRRDSEINSASTNPSEVPTDEQTKKKNRADHSPGVDFQESFPKGFSALRAVAPPSMRAELDAAVHRARNTFWQYVEDTLPLTRRGRGGRQRETAKLMVAQFMHLTSRNGDPQLHFHDVVLNACLRKDGTWATVDTKVLHQWARTLGPLMGASLAKELVDSLGLELVEVKSPDGKSRGWFEIAGISESLIKQWSSRQEDLITQLEGEGRSLGDATAEAKERAAIMSRPKKEAPVAPDELYARWQREAAEHGFTPEKALALCHRVQPQIANEAVYEQARKEALAELTVNDADFTERRLIQAVAEKLQLGQFSGPEIAQRVRRDLDQSKDVVKLLDQGRDRCFTTKQMWELERELLQGVEALKSQKGAVVDERIIERNLRRHPHLDGEQEEAAKTVLSTPGPLKIMTGIAGAGKTTALLPIKDSLQEAGYNVFGAAVSGNAKEVLAEKTQMPCRTVASYLYHLEKSTGEKLKDRVKHEAKQVLRALQGKRTYRKETIKLDEKSVLILDEAGMLDTRTMTRFIQLAEKTGATLILVGDTKQIQPILAGGPLQRLAKEVPTVHLSVNRRQQDEQDRVAVADLRSGEGRAALQSYLQRGRLHIGENRHEAITKLVTHWADSGGARRPAEHVVFTQTRAEAAEVNRLCQEARLAASRLPHIFFARNDRERFYRGDRVLFHEPDRRRGIENGFRGTVVSVDPIRREIKVQLDRQSQTVYGPKSPDGLVTIPLKEFDSEKLTLGYTSTTHKGQGATVPHAYILFGGQMTGQEMTYVQATRAEKSTHFFIDRAHVGEELNDIITAVEKSQAKHLAHDRAPREKRMQGPELEHER